MTGVIKDLLFISPKRKILYVTDVFSYSYSPTPTLAYPIGIRQLAPTAKNICHVLSRHISSHKDSQSSKFKLSQENCNSGMCLIKGLSPRSEQLFSFQGEVIFLFRRFATHWLSDAYTS